MSRTRHLPARLLTPNLTLTLTGSLLVLAPAAGAAPCTPPAQRIGAVQGRGDATPLAGQQVSVTGTVVGDEPGLSGFHLQDGGNQDRSTSDAIFVFQPGAAVDLGDTVNVTGPASEYFSQAQISAATAVSVCVNGTLADLPRAAELDLPADDAARERLEGMLVRPTDRLSVMASTTSRGSVN
ncbi:MAG: hypothetical protein ACRYF3_15510 [Janthinobacterium lividum]